MLNHAKSPGFFGSPGFAMAHVALLCFDAQDGGLQHRNGLRLHVAGHFVAKSFHQEGIPLVSKYPTEDGDVDMNLSQEIQIPH